MSTAPTPPPATTLLVPPENAVRAQFANAPSLESVTRQVLAAAIAQRYPSLTIDLERTQLAVPQPQGGWELQHFMSRVFDYLGRGTELDLSPINTQPYYLTDNAPAWLAPDEGTLDMKVIETLAKELSWRLPIALQNSLTDFWGQDSGTGISRWEWLSDVLRDTLSIGAFRQPDLTEKAREALYQVIRLPYREERASQYGDNAVQAYWLEVTFRTAGATRSRLSGGIVLTTPDQVLACRPDGSTRSFRNLDSMSTNWGKRISRLYTTEEIRIKRFELDGNVFDASAAVILHQQLERIGLLKLPSRIGWQALQRVYMNLTDTADLFSDAPHTSPHALATLKKQLPDWLDNASAAEQAIYRHYSLALSNAKKNSKGRTYLYGISDIHTYAADVLLQQMQFDQKSLEQDTPGQPPEKPPHPDDIELTLLTVAGLPGSTGIVEPVTMSLTELALKNLAGRPKGSLTLRHRQGLPLPPWLTPDYITRRNGLIEQVNIGKAYPERLENLLLSTTPAAQEREQLFAAQTRVQLPLEALELSLKKENGVTPLGARYVAALMQASAVRRVVDGLPVVIRRLALVRKPEALPDTVSNMFIIEPHDVEQGPHLLYRPFYARALIEFPSRSALLDAIAEPGELQDSVLTWLNDITRPIYANGGFKEPHYVRFGQGSEYAPIETPGPAQLATNGTSDELLQYLHNGRLMLFLYGCNARALVEQADTRSVSNSESRWAVLLEGGSLVFSSLMLLPALPRQLLLTGGLLGLTSAVSQDIPALESADTATRELAAADVLLNVGMLLFHNALSAAPRLPKLLKGLKAQAIRPFAPVRIAELWPEPTPPKIIIGAVALAGEFPDGQSTVLDLAFVDARNNLTQYQRQELERFKVPRPDALPPAQPGGLHKGMYRLEQKWHVLIGQNLYPAEVDLNRAAFIVSATDSNHHGPALKSDNHGNWALNTQLRLLGGMPSGRMAAYLQNKASRKNQLEAELQTFYQVEEPLHKAVDITQSALQRAYSDPRFTGEQLANLRARLNNALQKQQNAHQQLLDSRQERIDLLIPFNENEVISLLEKSFDNTVKALRNLAYEQKALVLKWPQFTTPGPELDKAGDAAPEVFMHYAREQIALNEQSIHQLELRNSFLDQLYNFSEASNATASHLSLILSKNEHSELTLKSFQLDCLKLASSKVTASAFIEESLDEAIDPLKEHLRTHNELNDFEFSASKRLEVLDSLVMHYGQALDALQGISLLKTDDLQIDYFNKLRQLLGELYQDVVTQLAAEIKPSLKPRKRSRKRTPSAAGKPQKKMINTRSKGPLIGDLRPAGGEWPIEVIEIRSAYDNKLLSTYSQHGEEWVEIKTHRPPPPPAARALSVIKGEARKLFARVEENLRKARQYKTLSRHPEEVEELLNNEATKLDKVATELHFALQAQSPASRLAGDQTLVDNMRSAARHLVSEGRALRIQLSLELPPTHGNLQYLLEQQRVHVAGLGKRTQLQGERRDFIQEYAVNNSEGYPLWYAHLHYDEANTPKQDFTVAHLKTRAQRKQSYYTQLADAHSGQAIVNVHRGQIGKALAERWFLPLVP